VHEADSQKNNAPVAVKSRREQSRDMNPTYGLQPEEIASRCKVNLSTARRWKDGTSRVPYAASVLLTGELSAFGPHLSRWRIDNGDLISPEGWRVTLNDALAVPLLLGQIAALRSRVKELEDLSDSQPYPGSAPDFVQKA
jgi:hypothetical protein